MRFINLTREIGIGANSYLLEAGGTSVVLDAGMHPKMEGRAAAPDFSLLDGRSVDAVVLTHAHQDHVGCLPLLTREFGEAPVFMTRETARIADVMLHNSANVMMRQREASGSTEAPLFTHRGVDLGKRNWMPVLPGIPFDPHGERASRDGGGVLFEFFRAGHILGSAGVGISAEGKRFFYTGDLHTDAQTLMRAAEFPERGVDVLLMECTRGDAPQAEGFTRQGEEDRLAELIMRAFREDVSLTIPVFALGKTQELLAMIWEMRRKGKVPVAPVYIGGLSTRVTEIYDEFCETEGRLHPGLRLLDGIVPQVVSGRDVEELRPRKRCIYALSSGMMTEHTLSNVFVRRLIGDPAQHLAFVGYSDPESPAGILRKAERGQEVRLGGEGSELPLRCHVHEFNFSAHAPREGLLEYAVRVAPSTILLVHGDPPAIEWFRERLAERLPGTRVIVPAPGEAVDL